MIEIEKKFLVKNNSFIEEAQRSNNLKQGYLNSTPERTVRVRISDNLGFLTIKGKGNATGMSRFEWEKEISLIEAEQLFAICEPGVIEKTRYLVKKENHTFEVDVFYGENEGLIVAEIELSAENETFIIPEWLGKEVTNDTKYYNSYLSLHPFTKW